MSEKLDRIREKYTDLSSPAGDKLLFAAFIVVDKNGNTLYSNAKGKLTLDANSHPYSIDSGSQIYSMTKLVTAVCVMQLLEKGAVRLDDDVRSQIPELQEIEILKGFDGDKPILEKNTKPITLWNLMTHTSGLPYDLADPDIAKWGQIVGRNQLAHRWTREGFSTPLKFAPGEGWVYGTGIDWAGLFLEKVTGKTLGEYAQENIFGPLGMTSTTFRPRTRPELASHTAGWTFRTLGAPNGLSTKGDNPVPEEYTVESGGAGLFATPRDYAAFLSAVLQGKLIGPEHHELLFKPQLDDTLQKAFMAYGDNDSLAPEFPRGTPMNFALGGCLNNVDVAGKRRKGSMMWAGWSNPHWFIDRTTGIAATLVVQLLPFPDPVVKDLYDELERTVYSDLVVSA